MGKKATTLDEQIGLLQSRGLVIGDVDKAKECLMDIGYYRLGFYLFPFEESFPEINDRSHIYRPGSSFYDAVSLYYLDFDLRCILMRYLLRIEVDFRTYVTYTLSNKYRSQPTWFVDPKVVDKAFLSDFDKVYDGIRKSPVIARHHRKYWNDRYAPAWKTFEYMSFGNMFYLYLHLKNVDDRIAISNHFGVNQTGVFESYMRTIKTLRNACAHGLCIYDIDLPFAVKNGPAGKIDRSDNHKLSAALAVTEYMLGRISENRTVDMRDAVSAAFRRAVCKSPSLLTVIADVSGCKKYCIEV